MKRTTLAAAAALAAALLPNHVSAQYGGGQDETVVLTPVDLKGTVANVGQGIIALTCDRQPFVVKIDPRHTAVQCTGKAEQSCLQPGVLVRFSAQLDRKGALAQPEISELCIVTPSPTAEPGIHADTEPGVEGEEQPAKRKAKDEPGLYTVVGTIKQVKDNELQVVVERSKPMKVLLPEGAEIKIEVDDYSLARTGDEVTVKGQMARPPFGQQPGQVLGQEIAITLAKPLTAPVSAKKKPAKRATPQRAAAQRATK
ncbi:MAG: hypothetical protein HYX69_03980 [Planctomycetia bacterium]|nr:hypothetical protein [Planctomycetia bacterium]